VADKLGGFRPFQANGRFYVERIESHWQVVDAHSSKVLSFEKRADAEDAATFARAYVRRHGDIDLGSFPWAIDSALHYEDDPGGHRPWRVSDGRIVPSGDDPVSAGLAERWTQRFAARFGRGARG